MTTRPWIHNIHYHPLVLRAVPGDCGRALDVGCGRGLLTRELALRSRRVTGIDLDELALRYAETAGDADGRIEYLRGDVMRYPLPREGFDFVAAVAALHHLPLEPALRRFAEFLKPGGTLAIVGLYRSATPLDHAQAVVAVPTHFALRAVHGHADVGAPIREPDETLAEIRGVCRSALPGARIRRRLLFRYSLFWKKQSDRPSSSVTTK